MTSISVTYQDMADAAGKLGSYRGRIQDQLRRRSRWCRTWCSSGFVTQAASKAFDHAYSEFTQGSTKMIDGMNQMGKYLTSAAQTMQQTDESLAKGIGG